MQGDRKKRESTMRYSVIDGSLWAVMMQVGTAFLTPFALALNAPILVISALNSLPPFLGGVAQKVSAHFSDWGIERKKILVWGIAAQAVAWLLLAFLALYSGVLGFEFALFASVALAAMMFFFGGLPHPPWTALMGDILPEKARAVWLGYRSRMMGIIGIAAMLFAGYFLDLMKQKELMLGFAVLFGIAFLARLLGSYFLSLHWDPNPKPRKEAQPSREAANFAILLFMVFFSLSIGANYLSVYWLKMLSFDYFWFAAAAAVHMVFFSLSVSHWGRLIEKYGNKKVWVAAMALNSLGVFMPIFVRTPLEAILINVVAGALWGGMIITYMNYLYEITKPEERIKATAHSFLLLGAGTLVGTLAGGFILNYLGENSITSFHILLLLAGILRIAVAFIINAKTREVKIPPARKGTLELMANILTVYPFKGLAYDISGVVSRVKTKK